MTVPPGLNDFIEWDVSNWSLALKFWKKRTAVEIPSSYALEIGSKNGGLALWGASNGMKVLCTDVTVPSIEAQEKHKRFGVSHLIGYEALSALDIPYPEKFDVVMFKSVLGAIGTPDHPEKIRAAVHQIHGSLKKGGELWFAENLMASPVHRFLRRRYVRWGKRWRYVSVEEMKSFLDAFSRVEYMTVGFLGALGRTERQRKFLGLMDRALLSPLVPEAWRYIMIGVATK